MKTSNIYYHTHCHVKNKSEDSFSILCEKVLGRNGIALQTGCCGMAGAFGLKENTFNLSKEVYQKNFFEKYTECVTEGDVLVSHGQSCRHQFFQNENKEILHPIEFLANELIYLHNKDIKVL